MKNKNKPFGIIYSARNKITGEYYIGASRGDVETRRKDHIVKSNKGNGYQFHEAIATYGLDAFDWQQIDKANDVNELAQKEKNYILEYNSKDEGYNSDSGGGIQKIVYQYDITNGTLLNAFDSLEAAGKSVNTTKQRISSSCLSVNQTYKGYYWSYEFIEPFSPKVDKRYKGVNQYDLKGNYMETYKSVAFASKITEISKTSIAKVCRGERKSAGGYAWSYSNGV